MRAYYLTADLFFSSRVVGVAQQVGCDLRVVGSLEELLKQATDTGDCRLVLLDLTLPRLDVTETATTIKANYPHARIVAYAPHVHEATLEAAQAAGCDEVLSRGQFNREVERVLRNN
jgi:CheY-like chemotaxis protein